jgi:hypothetical protein
MGCRHPDPQVANVTSVTGAADAWPVVLTSTISDYLAGAMIPLDGGNQVGIGIDFRGSEVLSE